MLRHTHTHAAQCSGAASSQGFRFYMCNVPRMLMAMSHVAKSLLTERQKLKVKVLGDVSELLED